MSLSIESLSLFYLANVLLVLAVAGFAGWLGPRVALSRWRSIRQVDRRSQTTERVEDLSTSLAYEDALGATLAPETPLTYAPLPESADAFTLKAQSDEEHVEVRRAYLKLLQCYNPKNGSCGPEQGHKEDGHSPEQVVDLESHTRD